MKKLREFDLLESYNEVYDSLRVNTVSRTEDNKKVHFKPRNQITAYYNVTDTSSATRILGADFDTSQIRYMVVDGVKVYPTYYDETEEQVIEGYNMEEQSYATMSLNLDDDDMDYRQHINSPNEGYGEIMTTMALNNDVETYVIDITPTPDYDSVDSSLSKYESKGTSYVNTTYNFDSNGEHIITFYFKEGTDNLSSCFSYCNNAILIDCESFDLSQIYTMFIDGVMQTSVVSAYTFSDTNEHKVQCMTHDMTSMYYMFYNSKQLKSIKFGDSFNTSNVYTMYRTFRNCSNITEIDLSKLDLTNVETMNGLFHSCSNLKKVVLPENFGVNCVEMSYMFDFCYALDDLNYENLNMSNCKTVYYMFCGTPFETFNASIFDMTNMINCEGMFSEMSNLKSIDISGWNVENGSYCDNILSYCTSLETVIMDNTYINTIYLYSMFYNCTSLKEIDFSNSLGFYGDDVSSFFYGCTNLKTIKGIDKLHPKVYTNYLFQNCESLTSIDLSSWDMSNVLRTNNMFINCKKLTDVTIYSNLDSVSDYANMFSGVTSDGVLNYNIIHEEKILDMFVTNQKVSNFPSSWRLNPVTLEKTYVLTLLTNDAYVKNATVSLNNVVGVYNESDYTYAFENVQVISRQLPLIVDGIEVSQVDESKLVQYVYYGTNDELYKLIDFTTPTFDDSVIIENDATYPWAYNEELGFLTSTMHEHNVVTYVTINSGIIGDATITLYQKNESESNYDYSAIFNSANEMIYDLQGINSDNIIVNVNIEDGILKFGYQKDYSYDDGTDCLGIKKIEGIKLPEE